MGLIHIKERGGDEDYRFKKALKKAKSAIEEICDLSDEMEEQYGERYDERRMGYRSQGMEDYEERRSRDGRGRYM